jgi:hypothetical protein
MKGKRERGRRKWRRERKDKAFSRGPLTFSGYESSQVMSVYPSGTCL